MEGQKTIFNYLGEILIIYAVSILSMLIFTQLFGETAKDISTMFQMGSRGLAMETMVQFLGSSVIIIGLKYLLTESRLTAKLALFIRIGLMLLAIMITIVGFAWIFDWFPVDMWQPWVSFFIMFIVYFIVSYWGIRLKTNLENKKLDQALRKYQKEVAADETGTNQSK